MRTPIALALCSLLSMASAQAAPATPTAQKAAPEPVVREVMTQPLPDYPGKEALILTVEYPPGGADPVHRHDAHGFVYVLQGRIVMGVAGGREVTLGPGEAFHEGPQDLHTVGRNASKTEPARFVAFLLKDIGTPAVLPPH
ncbi:cupin domain-containing protein [Stenotrophomonas sp.]|uniref:cupin domain-containing protein n=1 Tax=Stenotrophomonas sp. TaxID=69392 RepID=UPI00289D09E6|nr:cupin domain-containing protein [Stenotrophomonas sp.]